MSSVAVNSEEVEQQRQQQHQQRSSGLLSMLPPQTLELAMARAVDSQRCNRRSVVDCINYLVNEHNVKVGLRPAARVGSLTGVVRALQTSTVPIPATELQAALNDALEAHHLDVAATLIANMPPAIVQASRFICIVIFFVLPAQCSVWLKRQSKMSTVELADDDVELENSVVALGEQQVVSLAQMMGAVRPAANEVIEVTLDELALLLQLRVVQQAWLRAATRHNAAKVMCSREGCAVTKLFLDLDPAATGEAAASAHRLAKRLLAAAEATLQHLEMHANLEDLFVLVTRYPCLRSLDVAATNSGKFPNLVRQLRTANANADAASSGCGFAPLANLTLRLRRMDRRDFDMIADFVAALPCELQRLELLQFRSADATSRHSALSPAIFASLASKIYARELVTESADVVDEKWTEKLYKKETIPSTNTTVMISSARMDVKTIWQHRVIK